MRPADRGATRTFPRGLLVLVPLLLGARVASGLYEERHPTVPWSQVRWTPLEQAEAVSRERQLNILYDFSAEWCGPCQDLDIQVFTQEEAAESINGRYVAVRVMDRMQEDGENPPAVEALLKKYRPPGFPTLIVVSPQGKKLGEISGYRGYTDTLRFLGLPTPSGRRPPPLTRLGERRRGASVGVPARSAGTR